MGSNSQGGTVIQTTKRSLRKRIFYAILLAVPTVILIQSGIKNIITSRAIDETAYLQLLDQEGAIAQFSLNLLYNSAVLEVGERLNKTDLEDLPGAMSTLIEDHPEIMAICSLQGRDSLTIHYSAVVPPETPELLINAPNMFPNTADVDKDTLEWGVKRWYFQRDPIMNTYCEKQFLISYIGYFKARTYAIVAISDMDRIKERVPVIFDYWQRSLPAFWQRFLRSRGCNAQVRFYDQAGENFYTIGNPKAKGWDVIERRDVGFLPWRMEVQVFPRRSKLIEWASSRGTVPWGRIVPNVSGVVCIILLALLTKRYWWG
jgi:hypothetical protein